MTLIVSTKSILLQFISILSGFNIIFGMILALFLHLQANSVSASVIKFETARIAVMSAYAPELEVLLEDVEDAQTERINGINFITGNLYGKPVVLFLSGISMVNAAMATQMVLDHYSIERIIFSGIAGGVDPELNIGDVIVADQWGQYLESLFARKIDQGYATIPFFEYPYDNFGMMHPRSVTVQRANGDSIETLFWFPVDEEALNTASSVASNIVLEDCISADACLEYAPKVVVGGSGVSGGAFIDNKEFREYTFRTFNARVLDMESSAVAHVAYVNEVPFIAVRSLADLAGGDPDENQFETFYKLAAGNAKIVLRELLQKLPETK